MRHIERSINMDRAGAAPGVLDDLRTLIDSAALTMAYQPIVDLRRAELTGYEALTRPAADSGFAHPGMLFDAAKEHGMLWPLEKITRQQAFSACTHWDERVRLFMNCTPEVFADDRFANEILDAVCANPSLTPDRFVLEITERSDTQHIEGLDRQVRLLRQRGFQIAIDDVGAGTSGLNRIMSLRPHWLKLDIELIKDIDRDRVKQNLVKFLIHFAQLSGVRVVAEGIERHEELAALIRLGIRYGQGFLLARPAAQPPVLDNEISSFLRSEWAAVHDVRARDPRLVEIARFATPVEQLAPTAPVRHGAAALARESHMPGIALVRNGRFVGWCDRQRVLIAARTGRRGAPLSDFAGANSTSVPSESTVAEALDIAAARDDQTVSEPLIVTDDEQVIGAVGVRELLNAAGAVVGAACRHSGTLLQLPGRVHADQHLDGLIAARRSGVDTDTQAALIDIQQCSAYNSRFGYELGNELIEQLAIIIEHSVTDMAGRYFLAHLGDDRFLVTGPCCELAAHIDEIVKQYEERTASMRGIQSAMATEQSEAQALYGLRVLLLPDALATAQTPGDVYAQAVQLRANHNAPAADNAMTRTGCSLVLRAA